MPTLRKYMVFLLVAGTLIVLDQWTKHLADTGLATGAHPQPIFVGAEEAGEPLASALVARFPGLKDTVLRVAGKEVSRLDRVTGLDPDQSAFAPVKGPHQTRVPLGYYVFADRRLDKAPRRVELVEKALLTRWLGMALADRPVEEVRAIVDAHYGDVTLAEHLAAEVYGIDAGEAAALIRDGYAIPYFSMRRGVEGATEVKEGELYLLHDRKVDVIPGLFRFHYKENPGAAWGFLASASDSFRQVFLSGINVLASLVILIILVRLGAGHWSAILAFAGIFSGAVGNVIDRINFNYVIDFVDMYVSHMHWPTYNVADVGITVGVIVLVVEMLFFKNSPFAQGAKDRSEEAA